jgi:hypothetical protein
MGTALGQTSECSAVCHGGVDWGGDSAGSSLITGYLCIYDQPQGARRHTVLRLLVSCQPTRNTAGLA